MTTDAGTVQAMALWLYTQLPAIRHHQAAPDIHAEITAAHRQAVRVIDRPPQRVYAGPCDCGQGELLSWPGRTLANCDVCGATYGIAERQEWMRSRLADHLVTAHEASLMLPNVGIHVSDGTIRMWHHRNRLEAHFPDGIVRPKYRLGDIVVLALARQSVRTLGVSGLRTGRLLRMIGPYSASSRPGHPGPSACPGRGGRMTRLPLLLAAAALAAGCGTSTVTQILPPPTHSSGGPSGVLIVQVHDPGQVTIIPGLPGTGPCDIRHTPDGDLPDPACTPGSYDPAVTAETLCDPAYSTSAYRPPSSQTSHVKWDVVAPAYGIQDHPVSELDHLISLDLGGSNATANLWIEVGKIPNDKDAIEGHLHDWVCAGGTIAERAQRLQDAQAAIATDWTDAERVLGA